MAKQYEALCDFIWDNPEEQYEWKQGLRLTVDEEAYRRYFFIMLDHHVRVGDLKLVTDA
jgi:hypothetical protein